MAAGEHDTANTLLNPPYLATVAPSVRRGVTNLWALDRRLAELARVRPGSEPMLARIRLQYWRDEVAKRDPTARDPLLAALAVISPPPDAAQIAVLIDAWDTLVAAETFHTGDADRFAHQRGTALFALIAGAMGRNADLATAELGAIWAYCDLGLHSSNPSVARHCFAMAAEGWLARRSATAPRALVALASVAALVGRNGGRRQPLREQALLFRIRMIGR